MRMKRFFISVVAASLLLLLAAGTLVAAVDPLKTGGAPEGSTALYLKERYEMAGLIRNQEYSSVVMGTSLVANYRASWFEDEVGEKVLKITFPNGLVSEFDAALDLAYRTHGELEQVFFGLDPNILVSAETASALPEQLYNDSRLDDLPLYFSADTLALTVETLIARSEGTGTDLDSAYVWDDTAIFSIKQAMDSYPRPEVSGTTLPEDAYRAVCEENLAVVESWIEEHPDTEFVIWFPPYSILYWDKVTREGREEAILWAVEYAVERLLQHNNVKVHCFLISTNTILNLNNYTDHIHCSSQVTKWMAEEMLAGRWRFAEENYKIRLDELREFVASYDYDSLFAE